jgi:hypothetical protein
MGVYAVALDPLNKLNVTRMGISLSVRQIKPDFLIHFMYLLDHPVQLIFNRSSPALKIFCVFLR